MPIAGVAPARPRVPHGGKGAAVRAGMLAATGDLVDLRRRRHGDAARPAPAARRRAGRPRRRARVADPARRLGHAGQPARLPAAARQGLPRRSPRSGSSGRSRTRSAASRASRRDGRAGPVRAPAGHEHRLRRRAHLPRPPARLPDRDRARSAGTTGAARACAPGPGLALRVAWDLFRIPLHPPPKSAERRANGRDGSRRARPGWRGPPCRSSPCCPSWLGVGADAGRRRATRSATTSWPITRPSSGCSTAQPLYDMSFTSTGGVRRSSSTRRPFALAFLPFALLPRRRRPGPGSALSLVAFVVGVAILPVSRAVRWWILLLAGLSFPFVYSVKLGQVGPMLFLLFAIGWRWHRRPDPPRASAARSGRRSRSSRVSSSSGRC